MPNINNKAVQKKIATEYTKNGCNAEKAVIAAGYSPAYARGNAHKLVAKSCIRDLIDEINKDIQSKDIADAKEINEFWTSIIRDKDALLSGKLKASELRAKASGMFINKTEITGDTSITIISDVAADDS